MVKNSSYPKHISQVWIPKSEGYVWHMESLGGIVSLLVGLYRNHGWLGIRLADSTGLGLLLGGCHCRGRSGSQGGCNILRTIITLKITKKKMLSIPFNKLPCCKYQYAILSQLISECLFGALNFPKNQRKIWQISALETKKSYT